jgi:hypothetical protein
MSKLFRFIAAPLLAVVPVIAQAAVAAPPAAVLVPQGALPLPAPVSAVRSSADGTRLVIQLQATAASPAMLQVVDTTDASRPIVLGTMALDHPAELALSGDGRLAVLVTQPERAMYNRETAHDVSAVDLSDPRNPRVLWRHPVAAAQVAVAARAGAYAYSRRSAAAQGQWETVVVAAAADRQVRAVVRNPPYSSDSMSLSPGADVLVQVSQSQLTAWSLAAAPPRAFEQAPVFLSRFAHGCVPAVLDTGHVVLQDTRASRLGVYALQAGLPRVAAPAHEEGEQHCQALDPNGNGTGLTFAVHGGRVMRWSFADPAAPFAERAAQLPAGLRAVAAGGDVVVAAGASAVQVFRWARSAAPAPDWQALAAVHASVMSSYQAVAAQVARSGPQAAVDRLEAAGVLLALDAPVAGITPRRAAAILNDYGFIAAKAGAPAQRVEAALRRAIALDPGRAVAHLNLADVLREGLGRHAANGVPVEPRAAEIERHYRAYLAAGGKPSGAMTAFLRGRAIVRAGGDGCDSIAALANAGVLHDWVTDTGSNLPWRGRRIDLAVTTEGSAGVPALYTFDSASDRPLEPPDSPDVPNGEGLWGGDELGLVLLGNRPHVLHYRDLAHPVSSVSLDTGEVCLFNVATTERIGPEALEPALCQALQAGKAEGALRFDEPAAISAEAVYRQWGETSLGGTLLLDFANDGKPRKVAELLLDSGAGPGCGATFYELLTPDSTGFESGPTVDLLWQLQGGQGRDTRWPVSPCGNQPRFISHAGRIHFETRPRGWPPRDRRDQYHRVTRVEDGRVREVCDFRFESVVSVAR